MYYRDEDPARTSSPDECFNSFMSDLTGRSADDIDFYEKRPIDPEPSQYEKEQEALRKAEHDKQVNYFMKAQIDRYARSSEQRDMMYKQHGIKGE
jgi:hypothetical protein